MVVDFLSGNTLRGEPRGFNTGLVIIVDIFATYPTDLGVIKSLLILLHRSSE